MIDLVSIETRVREICLEVGEFIRVESLSFDRSQIHLKQGFNNLVSYVDRESERRLVDVLLRLIPGAGLIGEIGRAHV